MKKRFLFMCLSAGLLWVGCKSTYEKQGDEHLKEARPIQALQRYNYVIKSGKGSPDFEKNLTKAYIGALEINVANKTPAAGLTSFRTKIQELITKTNDQETKVMYTDVAAKVSKLLIDSDDFDTKKLAFEFMNDVLATPEANAQAKSTVEAIKSEFLLKALDKASSHLKASQGGNKEEGIIADYTLAEAALLMGNSQGLDSLWSEIRKENLSIFLMYDREGLIENPLPPINQFGVLLAIRVLDRKGNNVNLQVQAFNGSSNHVQLDGNNLSLFDKNGNEYKPVKKGAAFSSVKPLLAGGVSEVGSVGYVVPAEAQLDHIKLETESGKSIKWLP